MMPGIRNARIAAAALCAILAAAPAAQDMGDPEQPPEAQAADDVPTPEAEAASDASSATAESAPPTMMLKSISVTATRNPIEAFEYPGMVTVVDGARQAWLERHKRYPRRARLRHLQGTALLHFTMDREGSC